MKFIAFMFHVPIKRIHKYARILNCVLTGNRILLNRYSFQMLGMIGHWLNGPLVSVCVFDNN